MKHGCRRTDCKREAFIIPVINIPAVGFPIDLHKPARQYVDMPVCKEHFDEVKVDDFCDATIRQNLEDTLASMGRVAPDFGRAWVSKLKIDSDEYRKFKGAAV